MGQSGSDFTAQRAELGMPCMGAPRMWRLHSSSASSWASAFVSLRVRIPASAFLKSGPTWAYIPQIWLNLGVCTPQLGVCIPQVWPLPQKARHRKRRLHSSPAPNLPPAAGGDNRSKSAKAGP